MIYVRSQRHPGQISVPLTPTNNMSHPSPTLNSPAQGLGSLSIASDPYITSEVWAKCLLDLWVPRFSPCSHALLFLSHFPSTLALMAKFILNHFRCL